MNTATIVRNYREEWDLFLLHKTGSDKLGSGMNLQNVVKKCEQKPLSMDFNCPRKERGLMCGRHGEGLD